MSEREIVRVTPYRDGPLLVRGPARLVGLNGEELEPRRRTVALCRCGKSKIHPFCDGTHKQIGFRAPAGETVEVAARVEVAAHAQAGAGTPAGSGATERAQRNDVRPARKRSST